MVLALPRSSDGLGKASAGAVPTGNDEQPKTIRMWKGRPMEVSGPSLFLDRYDRRDESDNGYGHEDDGWSFFQNTFMGSDNPDLEGRDGSSGRGNFHREREREGEKKGGGERKGVSTDWVGFFSRARVCR